MARYFPSANLAINPLSAMSALRRLLAAGAAASLVAFLLLRQRKQSRTHAHATTLEAAGARSQLRAQRRALQEQQRAAKSARRSSGRPAKRPAQRAPQTAAAVTVARSPTTSQTCPVSFGASRALTAVETRDRLLSVLQAE